MPYGVIFTIGFQERHNVFNLWKAKNGVKDFYPPRQQNCTSLKKSIYFPFQKYILSYPKSIYFHTPRVYTF